MAYTTFASKTAGNYTHRLQYQLESQSIANNTSEVSWRYTITRNVSAANGAFWGDNRTFTAKVNGTTRNESKTFDFRIDDVLTAVSRTGGNAWTIAHNADGTKTVSGSFEWDNDPFVSSGFAAASDSGTFTLPTIPRASNSSFSGGSSFDAGDEQTIVVAAATDSFTHTIDYTFGSQTNVLIASGVNNANPSANVSWTPPLSLLNEIPNAASGTGTLRTRTYSGGTLIGTTTTSFTLHAPSEIVPTFDAPMVVEEATTSPDVESIVGAYVAGVSTLHFELDNPAGVYGSTISSGRFTVNKSGAVQQVNAPAGNPITGTTAPIPSGTYNVIGRVTDSRGRSFERTQSITVLAYAPPQINAFSIQRANSGGTPIADGTYFLVTLDAAVSSLLVSAVEKNELKWVVKTRVRGNTTPWASITADATDVTYDEDETGALTFDSTFLLDSTYSSSASFEIRIEAHDNLGTVSAIETVVPTGGVALHLDKDADAVGIGKFRDQGALDVRGTIYQAQDDITSYRVLDASDIPALLVPSGVISLWATNTAPSGYLICDGSAVSRTTYANLFAVIGTTYGSGNGSTTFNLPNLKGRVPVGRDSSQTEFDTLNEQGGAKTVTLTVSEMPSHNHGGATGSKALGPGLRAGTSVGAPATENRFALNNSGALYTNAQWAGSDHNHSISAQGGGGAHQNLQPYIVLNYIIKT